VNAKINEYFSNVQPLVDFYENVAIHVNGDQDANTVFESIESGIVNRLTTTIEIINEQA
jgi:adenylate kinase family enzyme